jgi:hypothetical protein
MYVECVRRGRICEWGRASTFKVLVNISNLISEKLHRFASSQLPCVCGVPRRNWWRFDKGLLALPCEKITQSIAKSAPLSLHVQSFFWPFIIKAWLVHNCPRGWTEPSGWLTPHYPQPPQKSWVFWVWTIAALRLINMASPQPNQIFLSGMT